MRPVPENAECIVEALNAAAQIKTAEPEQRPSVSLPSSVAPSQKKRDQERAQIGAPSAGSTLRRGLITLAFALYRPVRPIVRSVVWRSRSFFSQAIIEEVGSSRGHVIEAMESSNARLASEILAVLPRLEG